PASACTQLIGAAFVAIEIVLLEKKLLFRFAADAAPCGAGGSFFHHHKTHKEKFLRIRPC
ncbi:MAG: hypothetical protein ACT4QE_08670, partial [Anaerolineales bacterium]